MTEAPLPPSADTASNVVACAFYRSGQPDNAFHLCDGWLDMTALERARCTGASSEHIAELLSTQVSLPSRLLTVLGDVLFTAPDAGPVWSFIRVVGFELCLEADLGANRDGFGKRARGRARALHRGPAPLLDPIQHAS